MLIKESKLIPEWLKDDLEGPCPYCNSTYEVGYSPNELRVTKHYCPNKYCPGTIAMKMVFMWKVLKVEGIKFGKSMELIKKHKIQNHMEALLYIFNEKPSMNLATFMRLCCIQGIDDAWYNICEDKTNIEEVLQVSDVTRILTPSDVKDINSNIQYVNILVNKKLEYESVVSLTVMITGDVMELSNRELLIVALNKKYKGLLDLRYSKNKRKTGINVLIKEDGAAITGKTTAAIESGVRIMTSTEFILYVDSLIKEKAGAVYYDI